MSDLKSIARKLQVDIGESPEVEIDEFVNWAKTRKIENLLVVKPKSLQEVQNVVKAAAKNELRVRCSGSHHSWSPMFADEGNILMCCKEIQRHDGPQLELLQGPGDSYRVNVMGGTTVEELMEFEVENDVNIMCNTIITSPTCAGILTMGCHGVGWECMALSDYCTQMRIVDASGELRTYRKEDDLDMMLAVQCNLGLFGIIYDMQLEVKKKIIAHVHDDFNYNGDLFYDAKRMKELATSTDSLEIFHFPFNSVGWIDAAEQLTRIIGTKQTLTRDEWDPKEDQLYIRRIQFHDPKEVEDEELATGSYYKALNIRSWLEGRAMQVLDDFIVTIPQEITPLAMKASHNFIKETTAGVRYQPLVNAIHYRTHLDLFSVQNMEVAINPDKDFKNVAASCQLILELLRQEAEHARFPVNLIMEMRFMKYSDAYLCPAIVANPKEGGSGHAFYLEIVSYSHTPHWEAFVKKLCKELMKMPGVIFHWGKEWDYIEGVDEYIQKTMAKQIKKFKSALARSKSDPNGVFLNDKLQHLLFPESKVVDQNANGTTKNMMGETVPEQTPPVKSEPPPKKSSTCIVL